MLGSLRLHQIIDEILDTVNIFNSTLGVVPKYFRPPFGEIDLRIKSVVEALGMQVLRWNFDSYDYLRDPVQLLDRYKLYIKRDGPRTPWMSLMHDLHNTTVATQKSIIRWARQQGFNVTTPSACLNSSRWVRGELPRRPVSFWTTATGAQPTRTAILGPGSGLGGGIASLYQDGARPSTTPMPVGSATVRPATASVTRETVFATASQRATGTLIIATPPSAPQVSAPAATTTNMRPSSPSSAGHLTPSFIFSLLAILIILLR